jgi:hypothetical protein
MGWERETARTGERETVTATPEQQALINHDPRTHGRALAGPGTGKSWASVALLARLTEDEPDIKVGS